MREAFGPEDTFSDRNRGRTEHDTRGKIGGEDDLKTLAVDRSEGDTFDGLIVEEEMQESEDQVQRPDTKVILADDWSDHNAHQQSKQVHSCFLTRILGDHICLSSFQSVSSLWPASLKIMDQVGDQSTPGMLLLRAWCSMKAARVAPPANPTIDLLFDKEERAKDQKIEKECKKDHESERSIRPEHPKTSKESEERSCERGDHFKELFLYLVISDFSFDEKSTTYRPDVIQKVCHQSPCLGLVSKQ
jgi:hypothetical protein